ncbi:DsbA family protein [archaeon]|nr:DsbA family protein [archaeon]
MKKYGFVIVILIVLVVIIAYFISTDPYNRAKRDRYFMGNEDAKTLIVEVGDYLDPTSAASEENMVKLREEYDVKFIYVHYNSFNFSRTVAMAAECAGVQKDFELLHGKLFDNYLKLNLSVIYSLGKDIHLDRGEFENCISSELYSKIIDRDYDLSSSLDISVLPVVFINGERFDGLRNYSVYQEAVEKGL